MRTGARIAVTLIESPNLLAEIEADALAPTAAVRELAAAARVLLLYAAELERAVTLIVAADDDESEVEPETRWTLSEHAPTVRQ